MRLYLSECIQWSVWGKCLRVLSYYIKGFLDFIHNFIKALKAASILVFMNNRGYFWTWKGVILPLILNTLFFLVRVLSMMFMMLLTFLFVFFLLIFIFPRVFCFLLFLMFFLFLLMFMRTWSTPTPTSRYWFRSYFFRTIPWINIFRKLSGSFWI